MTIQEIELMLERVILDCRAFNIPGDQLDEMLALTHAGEPGIALENLCTQLFEYDVTATVSIQERLSVLGRAMGLEESRRNNVRKMVRNGDPPG